MSIDIQSTAAAIPGVERRPRLRTFASIEAGRGLAALLVVAFHADKVAINPAYWGAHAAGGALVAGHAGVEFFFVLSGFIIAHVHSRDIGQPAQLRSFVRKRFNRVYPLYWLVLSAVVALTLIGPAVPSLRHIDAASVVSSYLLAGPDSFDGVLTVSWTLFHELLFYLAFAVLIIDRRAGTAVALGWAALIALGATTEVDAIPAYVLSPLNLLFAAGAVTYLAVRQRRARRPLRWVALGALGFVALAVEEAFAPLLAEMPRNLLYGIASAVALAGVVSRERERPFAVPALLSTLGAASFSIYLVHYPALSVVARAMRGLGLVAALPMNGGVALLVVIVVGCGIAVHFVVERPLLEWLAARSPRRGTPPLRWVPAP